MDIVWDGPDGGITLERSARACVAAVTLRPDATVECVECGLPMFPIAEAEGRTTGLWPSSGSPYLELRGSWDEYFGSLPGKFRQNVRNRIARLRRMGEPSLLTLEGDRAIDEGMADAVRLECVAPARVLAPAGADVEGAVDRPEFEEPAGLGGGDLHDHVRGQREVDGAAVEEDDVDLLSAALLIAKLDNDEVDLAAYRKEVERMERDVIRRT